MNVTATAAVRGCSSLAAAGGGRRGGRCAIRSFRIAGITVQGEVTHNNAVTLRANVAPRLAGNFFTVEPGRRARSLRVGALGAQGGGAARVSEPAAGARWRSTGPVAHWGDDGESRLVNNFGEVFEANVGEVEHDDLPRLDGPDEQAAPGAGACTACSTPLFEPLDLAIDAAGADERAAAGELELDTGAVDRAGARARRGGGGAHAALPADADARWPRAVRPPARRRWCRPTCGTATAMRCGCGACTTVVPTRRRNRTNRGRATWQKNTKTWSSDWTSAPPR